MSERGGVEIDYCPNHPGVWLDRGASRTVFVGRTTSRTVARRPIAATRGENESHWPANLFD